MATMWHSYTPFTANVFVGVLLGSALSGHMALKAVVLEHLDEIYERFVINVNRPGP